MNLLENFEMELGKKLSECNNEEIYCGLLKLTGKMSQQKKKVSTKKKLYYISAEFLIGKLLSNNLINLGIYEEVKSILESNGKISGKLKNWKMNLP